MSNDSMHSTDKSSGGPSLEKQLEVSEQRRKDAQAALTPTQQENARLKAELNANNTPAAASLTPEQATALDDLKFTNPDEWRRQMNENESTAANARQEQISSETRKFQDKQTVENFFADNPKYSYDVVKQIIPNAIQKRYEDGEINIETVLSVGKQLLDGAPIESVLAPDSPQIGKVAGSDKPTNGAKEKQVEKDWATSLV